MTMIPCVFGDYCSVHGFVHGAEAEELRSRLEQLLTQWRHRWLYDDDADAGELVNEIAELLEDIDARDSLAYVEWKARQEQAIDDE